MVDLSLEEALVVARDLIADLLKVADGAKIFDPRAEAVYLRRVAAVQLLIDRAEAPLAEDVDLVELVEIAVEES